LKIYECDVGIVLGNKVAPIIMSLLQIGDGIADSINRMVPGINGLLDHQIVSKEVQFLINEEKLWA